MSDAKRVVTLPSVLDLDALDQVRDGLIEAVELGGVEVDGRSVERVATNALVMLISAAETARHNSFGFSITGASAPMRSAVDRLGLSSAFSGMMKG
jgi:anti-anti-sigma regulatory factor